MARQKHKEEQESTKECGGWHGNAWWNVGLRYYLWKHSRSTQTFGALPPVPHIEIEWAKVQEIDSHFAIKIRAQDDRPGAVQAEDLGLSGHLWAVECDGHAGKGPVLPAVREQAPQVQYPQRGVQGAHQPEEDIEALQSVLQENERHARSLGKVHHRLNYANYQAEVGCPNRGRKEPIWALVSVVSGINATNSKG